MRDKILHDTAIAALALRQHGNVTRAQLLGLGLTSKAINHRIACGRLYPVHAGVYAVGRPPNLPLERAAAAVLACGPSAALSHASAVTLWGIQKQWRFPLEVIGPGNRRRPRIITHRSTTMHHRDLTTHYGIRVTTAARTLLDMARRLTDNQLMRAVNEAMHLRHLRHSHLAELLSRHPTHPNTPRLTPFLDQRRTGITRSALEDMFRELCMTYGLPTPLFNVRIAGYIVDAYFPDHGLIVELDSWEFHGDRHTFETDRNRDADTLLAGLVTVRVTYQRMKTAPAEEAARLRKILDNRTTKLPNARRQ